MPPAPSQSDFSISIVVFNKINNVFCIAQAIEYSLDLIHHSCGQHGYLVPFSPNTFLSCFLSLWSFCSVFLWRLSLLHLALRLEAQALSSSLSLLSFTSYLKIISKVYSLVLVPLWVQIHGFNCLTEMSQGSQRHLILIKSKSKLVLFWISVNSPTIHSNTLGQKSENLFNSPLSFNQIFGLP